MLIQQLSDQLCRNKSGLVSGYSMTVCLLVSVRACAVALLVHMPCKELSTSVQNWISFIFSYV